MSNSEVMWRMLGRAKELADLPMGSLRGLATGWLCEESPTKRDMKRETAGQSRGQLIETILSWEFTKDLEEDMK